MKFSSLSLRYENNKLSVLDQKALPQNEVWVEVVDPDIMVALIHSLQVRGAPMIGVAAAISLADYASKGASYSDYVAAAKKLRAARPTAVNLMHAIDKMLQISEDQFNADKVFKVALGIFETDRKLCESIADYGAELVGQKEHILTICNTGGLATVGVGTAMGIIRKAHEQGKDIFVSAMETRPLLQGGRLTAWELNKLNIKGQLIADSMAATLMREQKVDRVIVGADRVATNGDFANKIGTYALAIQAKHHGVPFYMAAPCTTLDPNCTSGDQIPIEMREPNEVLGVKGSFGEIQWAPDIQTYNPAFDVTPAELVTGWIFDKGVFTQEDIKSGKLKDLANQ